MPLSISEVHRATHRATGGDVALKRILMHNEKDGMPITALREIKILKALDHKNIVKVLDIVVTPRRSTVVAVLCIADIAYGKGNPTWLARYRWCSHTWTMTLLDS